MGNINKGIKSLIVDFGGVLVGLDRDRCIERFRSSGVDDVENLIKFYVQDDLFGKHEKGLIDDAQFRAGLRAATSGIQPSDEEIDAAWNAFLTDVPRCKLDALKDKRASGCKVFLLSNTNHIHWTYAVKHFFSDEGYSLDDCFDQVFLSYEMKMVKPDPSIFKAVLDTTGAEACETLFIDDSEANCRTAQSLGINIIHATPGVDWTKMI